MNKSLRPYLVCYQFTCESFSDDVNLDYIDGLQRLNNSSRPHFKWREV